MNWILRGMSLQVGHGPPEVSVLEWCLHCHYLKIYQAVRLCMKTLGPLWVCF